MTTFRWYGFGFFYVLYIQRHSYVIGFIGGWPTINNDGGLMFHRFIGIKCVPHREGIASCISLCVSFSMTYISRCV